MQLNYFQDQLTYFLMRTEAREVITVVISLICCTNGWVILPTSVA